jgi:hypothetical protein
MRAWMLVGVVVLLVACDDGRIGASSEELISQPDSSTPPITNQLSESDVAIVLAPNPWPSGGQSTPLSMSVVLTRQVLLLKFSATSNVPFTGTLDGGVFVVEDPTGAEQTSSPTQPALPDAATRCRGFTDYLPSGSSPQYAINVICARVGDSSREPDSSTNRLEPFTKLTTRYTPDVGITEWRVEVYEDQLSDTVVRTSAVQIQQEPL